MTAGDAGKMTGMCMWIALAALAMIFINAPLASAVTFDLHSIGGAVPANAVGGGNLEDTGANILSSH